jgi:acid stress chaperone HdeB
MRRNVLFIAAILLVAGSLPSAAQIRVDMNNMTCGNWLGYSPENREILRLCRGGDPAW